VVPGGAAEDCCADAEAARNGRVNVNTIDATIPARCMDTVTVSLPAQDLLADRWLSLPSKSRANTHGML